MREAEQRRLETSGAPAEDIRLACQSYTRGDLVIKVLAPGR